jgi:hypothetical protein
MIKRAALFTLISLVLCCPVIAKPHHHADRYAARQAHHAHHHVAGKARHADDADHYAGRQSHDVRHYAAHASHAGITCEMVRAYIAKVGLGQAIAMAKSAGISAADEQRARQCLANKI